MVLAWMLANAPPQGQASTNPTELPSGVPTWQPMQWDPCVLPFWVATCCFTSVIESAGVPLACQSVESSPTVNPSRNESFTTALCAIVSTPVLPTALGSADQNTMLPPAPTGATWKLTLVAPPLGV